MKFLKPYWKRFWKDIVLGQSFKLIEAILELIMPLVMASLIDTGIKTGNLDVVWSRGWQMLLLAAVGVATALVCQVVASKASQQFGTQLRRDVYQHINTLAFADLDKLGTPSLITRMTSDINQLQQALAMLIRLVARAPFLAIGSIVMAMMLDIQLSIVFLVTTPLIVLLLFIILRASIPHFTMLQKKLDTIARIARENLLGARVIRTFSRQKSETQRFDAAAQDYTDTAIRISQLSALLSPLTSVVMNAGILAVLIFGGQRVQTGALSQGVIIAFINYLVQILMQTAIVANLVVLFTKAGASATRVGEVLTMQPSITDKALYTPALSDTAPMLSFDHVTFTYPGGAAPALTDIHFSLKAGQTLGIIGGTGSGTSTLASLLPRFYDADRGIVAVKGVAVTALPLKDLRGHIGMVPQGAMLVSGSVRRNLQWGNADATDEELWQALDTAQASEFVQKLKGGLDFQIEEGGKNLSGGQRQRLTIARALVRKPWILILDDASSALDYATDAALRLSIRQTTTAMTVIIVSQRVSSIRQADNILVLDDGHLMGMGTHDKLMASCPLYKEICHSQLSGREVSA